MSGRGGLLPSAMCLVVPLLLGGGDVARAEEGTYFMPPGHSDGRRTDGRQAGGALSGARSGGGGSAGGGAALAGAPEVGAAADRVNSRIAAEQYYVTAPRLDLGSKFGPRDDFSQVGPFSIEHSNASPSLMEHGTTVTAAYPVKGVQGMDLVVNMFAGHRDTNTGSNTGSAALTAGVRFKW
ncbi:hypothetical protein [Acetobacter fallax]|uniref:Autotransporter domain-containing protein n=1 Tax=Acetobacter fallax TaxID=1737473 RepID=A0ABX0K4W9_9PROT|nr:hypothetical protein [Acetobacter fallax]NHO31402.1 hypothetical protein [Acetobacter fallax]